MIWLNRGLTQEFCHDKKSIPRDLKEHTTGIRAETRFQTVNANIPTMYAPKGHAQCYAIGYEIGVALM